MITAEDVRRAKDVAEKLMNAFTWDQTPQGGDYWNNVHDNLYSLKATDPKKATHDKIAVLRKQIEDLEKTL